MAKTHGSVISVPDLQRMLHAAKQETAQLQKERAGLVKRIDEIDQRLAALGGATRPGPKAKRRAKRPAKPTPKPKGKRPGRKKMTLADHVAKVLQGAKAPVSPQQIADAIKKKGASKSKRLAKQVHQVLASGKVAVKKVGRGQYVAETVA